MNHLFWLGVPGSRLLLELLHSLTHSLCLPGSLLPPPSPPPSPLIAIAFAVRHARIWTHLFHHRGACNAFAGNESCGGSGTHRAPTLRAQSTGGEDRHATSLLWDLLSSNQVTPSCFLDCSTFQQFFTCTKQFLRHDKGGARVY